MPDDRAMNTRRQELRECLDVYLLCSAKHVFAAFHRLPLLHFVSLESKRSRIGHICHTQILDRDGDRCFLVGRPESDAPSIDMKIARLIPQSTDTLYFHIEHVNSLGKAQGRDQRHETHKSYELHAASLSSLRTSKPFQIS